LHEDPGVNGTITAKSYARLWLLATLAVAAVFLLCLLCGYDVLLRRVTVGWPAAELLESRMLRLIAAAIVGFALGAAGVTLQALLRNPLADPYVLGISSGASVGVMLWLLFTGPLLAIPAVATSEFLRQLLACGTTIPAVAGAVVSCILVFVLARGRQSNSGEGGGGGGAVDPVTLLLVGVVISAINGALLMLLNNIAPGGVQRSLLNYVMGSINEQALTWWLIGTVILVLAGAYLPVLLGSRALNIGSLSDVESVSLGVNIGRLRTLCFICASIMTAAGIALSGPIGFVGLICPHICRSIWGADHRKLVVTAPLCGAAFLMAADSLVRVAQFSSNGELPVGVITALCGGPFFMVLLKRKGAVG